MALDEKGREIVSDKPVEVPLKLKSRDTQTDFIRDMIRRELSRRAADDGMESFEEADDFEVGDDFDPTSPYEEVFDPGDNGDIVNPLINGGKDESSPGKAGKDVQVRTKSARDSGVVDSVISRRRDDKSSDGKGKRYSDKSNSRVEERENDSVDEEVE